MGNNISKDNEPADMASLASHVDDIAIHYILTQNTIDLLRLTDKEYYDNLIVLTSNVIEKKFNTLELGFLDQRILGKQTVTEMIPTNIIPTSNKLKDKLIFNISKFYIKIIMVYSAIATTIDPQYSYEDSAGIKKTFYLKDMDEYKNIPKNVRPILVQLTNPMNLCRKRLSILKNKLDQNIEGELIKLNPGEQLCSMTTTNHLTDEVGIKELDLLYFDIFDYETKTWSKRSQKMKQKYNKDLTLFYQIFTGKEILPDNIKTFHDIELLDLSTLSNCSKDSFKQDLYVSNKNVLIQNYIQKINMIEDSTKKYRIKLVNILKELFVIDLKDNETKYILNPKLTMDHVILLETETRDTILNLYTSCEKYFIQALIIFEKIYDEQVKNVNENRLNFIDTYKSPDIFYSEPFTSIQPESSPSPAFMPPQVTPEPTTIQAMPEQVTLQAMPEPTTIQPTMPEPTTIQAMPEQVTLQAMPEPTTIQPTMPEPTATPQVMPEPTATPQVMSELVIPSYTPISNTNEPFIMQATTEPVLTHQLNIPSYAPETPNAVPSYTPEITSQPTYMQNLLPQPPNTFKLSNETQLPLPPVQYSNAIINAYNTNANTMINENQPQSSNAIINAYNTNANTMINENQPQSSNAMINENQPQSSNAIINTPNETINAPVNLIHDSEIEKKDDNKEKKKPSFLEGIFGK